MKKTLLTTFLLLAFASGLLAGRTTTFYRVLKFSENEVGIYCTNGADPTVKGNPTGHVLEVSCGN
jgi:hypothetical protein